MWFRALFQIALFVIPWRIRRVILAKLLKMTIAPSSYIGFTVILSDKIQIGPGARIGHLNVIKGLRSIEIQECASIGSLNWIFAFPDVESRHFADNPSRTPSLMLCRHAAITSRHMIDCTDSVYIGEFATLAGWASQILTHSIDLNLSRQAAAPVRIGDYCFVGTRVVILKGSVLPNRSVLAAGAVLTQKWSDEDTIYGGVPAKPLVQIDQGAEYFHRSAGYVW